MFFLLLSATKDWLAASACLLSLFGSLSVFTGKLFSLCGSACKGWVLVYFNNTKPIQWRFNFLCGMRAAKFCGNSRNFAQPVQQTHPQILSCFRIIFRVPFGLDLRLTVRFIYWTCLGREFIFCGNSLKFPFTKL